MQKPLTTQSELFVSSSDIDYPILRSLDNTKVLLGWTKVEPVFSSMYSSKTGLPGYPLLSFFHGLLLSIGYQLFDVQLAQGLYRSLLFGKFCRFEFGDEVILYADAAYTQATVDTLKHYGVNGKIQRRACRKALDC